MKTRLFALLLLTALAAPGAAGRSVEETLREAAAALGTPKWAVDECHAHGVKVISLVGKAAHAKSAIRNGADIVVVQGTEGGGHTGTVPTSLLVPTVTRTVDIPVIAAGGFNDGRGLVAALAWGAAGIAMGTRFLLSAESTVPEDVKRRYLQAGINDTVVTSSVDGHPQRVIRTELVEHLTGAGRLTALPRAARNALRFRSMVGMSAGEMLHEGLAMKKAQGLSYAQMAMAANAPMLTKAALVDGRIDAGVLPTGQVVGVIDALPTVAEIITAVVAEAEATIAGLGGLLDASTGGAE